MTTPSDRMWFGWLADQRLAWTALLGTARAVERMGYDGIWMSDHLLDEQGRWFLDAWTTLGATLACVPRIEAGLLVASNSLRPSMVTAQMANTLIDIGAGRFVLGLGAGGSRQEHMTAGVGFPPLGDRVAVLEATCRLVRGTGLRSPSATAAGQPPRQARRQVTLLVGGASDPILRLAGRYADRWTVWGSPDDLGRLGDAVTSYAHEAGREAHDIRRGAIVMLLPEHLRERSDPSPRPAELRGGRPAVMEQLARYQEAGTQEIIVCDYGLEPADRLAALEWFAALMMPFQGPPSR